MDLSVQMMDINEKAQIISDAKYCVHALDKKKLEFKDGDKIIYTVELTSMLLLCNRFFKQFIL